MFLYYLTVSYIKHNFKLKLYSKMCTFKTWKKFEKLGKNFEKMCGNPEKGKVCLKTIRYTVM